MDQDCVNIRMEVDAKTNKLSLTDFYFSKKPLENGLSTESDCKESDSNANLLDSANTCDDNDASNDEIDRDFLKYAPVFWSWGLEYNSDHLPNLSKEVLENIVKALNSKSTSPEHKEKSEYYERGCRLVKKYQKDRKPLRIEQQEPHIVHKINWRTGPARLWYDYLGLPLDATSVDYGFKIKNILENQRMNANNKLLDNNSSNNNTIEDSGIHSNGNHKCFPDDAFLMVTQQQWEDDVIWDATMHREKIMSKILSSEVFTGWTLKKYTNQFYSLDSGPLRNGNVIPSTYRQDFLQKRGGRWFSSLPVLLDVEHRDYIWEDDVIWDFETVEKILKPSLSYALPESTFQDRGATDIENHLAARDIKNLRKHIPQEEDNFNISNDYFYDYDDPRDYTRRAHFLAVIQHAEGILRLQDPYVMINFTTPMTRAFHRNKLISHPSPFVDDDYDEEITTHKYLRLIKTQEINTVVDNSRMIEKLNTLEELSGCSGNLILVEWSDQYPLFINEMGMCSAIINYLKRDRLMKHFVKSTCNYGRTAYVHQSPFSGDIAPGKFYSALENNMYRAPIYQHKIPARDFIVIRRGDDYYVREYNALFLAGQQCPFMQIPSPSSLEAKNIKNSMLLVYIYRLFWSSPYEPKVIVMSDLKRKFPSVPEQMYRSKLNMCATYRKVDHDGLNGFHWVLKSDFHLPSEREMQAMVSPEQYCAYFSMLAAHQRLKDIGLGCKFFIRDSHKRYLEAEMSRAPWNITNDYMNATARNTRLMKQNQSISEINQAAQGATENKLMPASSMHDSRTASKNSEQVDVSMTVKEATEFLKAIGVSSAVTKKLSTWDILDAARTTKRNIQFSKFQKFYKKVLPRSTNQESTIEFTKQTRYKKDFQRTYEVQRTKLSSEQILSSDDTDRSSTSSGEEEEIERLGKLVEFKLIDKNKDAMNDTKFINHKRKLERYLEHRKRKKMKIEKEDQRITVKPNECLRIARIIIGPDGKETEEVEYIRDSRVVNMYIAIRTTKDEKFLEDFIGGEENKRKKVERKAVKIKPQIRLSELKPQKSKTYSKKQSAADIIKKEAHDQKKDKIIKVKIVPPFKIILNRTAEKPKHPPSLFKKKTSIPKREIYASQPVIKLENSRKSYHPRMSYKRRDPVVMFCAILDDILINIRKEVFAKPFLVAVNPKHYPDYYIKVVKPMDLLIIHETIRKQLYTTREMFLSDVNQIVVNSTTYNGVESIYTRDAIKLLNKCVERLSEREIELIELEKMINPLLDNDKAAISFIFTNILNKVRLLPESRPFWKPVDKLKYKDYYDIVKNPMDMNTIAQNLKDQRFHTAADFLAQFELIVHNSDTYNGPDSSYSQCARTVLELAKESLAGVQDFIHTLEENIEKMNTDNVSSDSEESPELDASKNISRNTNNLSPRIYKDTSDSRECLNYNSCNENHSDQIELISSSQHLDISDNMNDNDLEF